MNDRMKRDFSIFTGLLKTARQGDDLILSGIASSTIKDRHGDTMTPRALESMLRSAEGMTIYLNHSYNVPEDVAGSVRQAWIDRSSNELHDLHFDIAINRENPRAVQAFNAIDKGTKLGLSIGAMIPEGGAKRDKKSGSFIIDDVELLETSIVSIPANPRSWVEYARKSLITKDDVPEIEDDPTVDHEPVVVETYAATPELNLTAVNGEWSNAIPTSADAIDSVAADVTADITVADDDPEAAKATVTVWPSGKVFVDTTPPVETSSQEAAEAEPETEKSDALAATLGEMARDIEPEVRDLLGPTVIASLQTSSQTMAALVDALTKATVRATEAEKERDAAVEAVAALTSNVEAFITRVAAHPRGRRAIARELPATARAVEGIRDSGLFSSDFLDMLQKGVPQ